MSNLLKLGRSGSSPSGTPLKVQGDNLNSAEENEHDDDDKNDKNKANDVEDANLGVLGSADKLHDEGHDGSEDQQPHQHNHTRREISIIDHQLPIGRNAEVDAQEQQQQQQQQQQLKPMFDLGELGNKNDDDDGSHDNENRNDKDNENTCRSINHDDDHIDAANSSKLPELSSRHHVLLNSDDQRPKGAEEVDWTFVKAKVKTWAEHNFGPGARFGFIMTTAPPSATSETALAHTQQYEHQQQHQDQQHQYQEQNQKKNQQQQATEDSIKVFGSGPSFDDKLATQATSEFRARNGPTVGCDQQQQQQQQPHDLHSPLVDTPQQTQHQQTQPQHHSTMYDQLVVVDSIGGVTDVIQVIGSTNSQIQHLNSAHRQANRTAHSQIDVAMSSGEMGSCDGGDGNGQQTAEAGEKEHQQQQQRNEQDDREEEEEKERCDKKRRVVFPQCPICDLPIGPGKMHRGVCAFAFARKFRGPGDMCQRMKKHALEHGEGAWPESKDGEPKLSKIDKEVYFWESVAPLTWKVKMGREARKSMLQMSDAAAITISHAIGRNHNGSGS